MTTFLSRDRWFGHDDGVHLSVRNLEQVPVTELKQWVVTLCAGLREMELHRQASETDAQTALAEPTISKQECERVFLTQIRPIATNISGEIMRRLGRDGSEERIPAALTHGMLAGPRPLEEVAMHIEKIARLLPDRN